LSLSRPLEAETVTGTAAGRLCGFAKSSARKHECQQCNHSSGDKRPTINPSGLLAPFLNWIVMNDE
jgi:hypothetical protein